MLRYLYSDALRADDAELALELFVLANRLNITQVWTIREHFVILLLFVSFFRIKTTQLITRTTALIESTYDFASLDNVLAVLAFAEQYASRRLVRRCLSVVVVEHAWPSVKAALERVRASDAIVALVTRACLLGAE